MSLTVAALNEYINGRIEGDEEVVVHRPAPLETASNGDVTFLANDQYTQFIHTTDASVIIVSRDFEAPSNLESTLIRVSHPYRTFTQVMEIFHSAENEQTGIHEHAFVEDSATCGADVLIGPQSYVGENVQIGENVKVFSNVCVGSRVSIGANTIIHPGVVIYHNCVIGKDCIIHGGTTIGSDGFGFSPQEDGSYRKIPQMGNAVVEDHVEIGANCAIDRATLGSTIIRQGVKMDNLIQVAHNVEIGAHTVVAAQAGISGSTHIGKHCVVGGQVGFVGHIRVGDGNQFQAQSGVPRSIQEKGKAWAGSPAFDYQKALRSQVVYKRLPDLERRLNALEQEIQRLQQETNKDYNNDER